MANLSNFKLSIPGTMLTGLIPMFIIIIIYYRDPDSAFLVYINELTNNFPKIKSSYFPLLSESLSLVVKIAPLAAILFCMVERRNLLLRIQKVSTNKIIVNCALALLLYFLTTYLLVFMDYRLEDNSRAIYKAMSKSQFLLSVYYPVLFIAYYLVSILFIMATIILPIGQYKISRRP